MKFLPLLLLLACSNPIKTEEVIIDSILEVVSGYATHSQAFYYDKGDSTRLRFKMWITKTSNEPQGDLYAGFYEYYNDDVVSKGLLKSMEKGGTYRLAATLYFPIPDSLEIHTNYYYEFISDQYFFQQLYFMGDEVLQGVLIP